MGLSTRACAIGGTPRRQWNVRGGPASTRWSARGCGPCRGASTRLAFVASPTPDARQAAATLMRRYDHVAARRGRRRGGARRRRADASGAAPLHACRHADLRHEPRHRRLPHERVPRGRADRAPGERPAQHHPPAADGGGGHRGAHATRRAPSTRSTCCARPTRPPSCTISVDGHVRLPELIADGVLARDPGRLHRLQPLGGRPDPAPQRPAPGADADLGLPAPALARRAAARLRPHPHRGARRRAPAGGGGGRPHRVPPGLPRWRPGSTTRPTSSLLHDPGHSLDERILREQFG